MSNDPILIDVHGAPLKKAETPRNDVRNFLGGGMEMSLAGFDRNLQGARQNPRTADWRLYRDMYKSHPVVKAAVDKKVMVATNTGFDFIPRTQKREVPEEEIRVAQEFFQNSRGFLNELRSVYFDLEIYGDAYMYIIKNRIGKPVRLKRLAPYTMHIKADKYGKVQKYVQKVPLTQATTAFRPQEIIHFRLPNPEDDLYGLSRLEAIKRVVTTDLLAENFNMNFFRNGATVGTVFVVKGATTRELEQNRAWIREEYVGTDNAFKPIMMSGEDIDVVHMMPTHQDMAYLEGREVNKKLIYAALDVPPAKVGDMESANRSNSKEQDKSFRTEAVMPLQNIVEDGITDQFLKDVLKLNNIQFKHSEGDIRDAQEQMDLWDTAAKMGFMTINEVRALMGLREIDGGDIAIVMTPTGAVPVTDLELYFTLAQANFDKIPPDARANRDGSMGRIGPNPSKPNSNERVTVQRSQESVESVAGVHGAYLLLKSSNDYDVTAKKALIAIEDIDNPIVDASRSILQKAIDAPYDQQRMYTERAMDILGVYLNNLEGRVELDEDNE